jgi:galactokinase/galacturonokinase
VPTVVSPYRVCPLGAHVDHQHGPVLGMAIGLGTRLAFAPASDARVRLASHGFQGGADFALDRAAPGEARGWQRYPRAAAAALGERLPGRPRGLTGTLDGDLPGGGLSSSASLLVACLLAMAHANELELPATELVGLARRAENEFVGVRCGVLDPATIVAGERGRLLEIDTRAVRWRALEPPGAGVRVLVVFTGRGRSLSGTPFNQRVEECRSAARHLARAAGLAPSELLGELPEAVLEQGLAALPLPLRGRARHFLEERRRVRAGVEAWSRGDFAAFGQLMSDSCRSSVENYETGSDEQRALQRCLLATPGVLGARFSGAGHGGCNVALVEADRAGSAREHALAAYRQAVPDLAGAARAFLVDPSDGARVV